MTTIQEQSKSGNSTLSRRAKVAGWNSFNWWSRLTDSPSYKVAGSIERFDQKDLVASRAILLPGSETCKEYHARHPEMEEDQKLRRYRQLYPSVEAQQRKRAAVHRREFLALALSFADAPAHHLARHPPSPMPDTKVVQKPEATSRTIKKLSRCLGANFVAISKLNPAWVYSHGSGRRQNRWGELISLDHQYAITSAVTHNFDFLLARQSHPLNSTIKTAQVAKLLDTIL